MPGETEMKITILCIAIALCHFPHRVTSTGVTCDDIDTQACQLIHAKRPDMCNDARIANSTCPKFCKNCPVTCYHCDIPLMDYNDCFMTKTCAKGEACMLKELTSTVDGHDEYFMTCAPVQMCDGTDLSFFFGKRDLQSRNVHAKCCFNDLCNIPSNQTSMTSLSSMGPTTSATTQRPHFTISAGHSGCRRDIVFIIDTSMRFYQYGSGIRPFLASSYTASIRFGIQLIENVVGKLTIGPYDNLVAMASFDNSVHSHWDLNRYHDKTALLHAISYLRANMSYKAQGDLEQAVQFVLNNALNYYHGDRPAYADDVVIVTDTSSPFHNEILKQSLHRKSQDVTVVYVQSNSNLNGNVSSLATDYRHVMHVSSAQSLPSAGDYLLKLLCT